MSWAVLALGIFALVSVLHGLRAEARIIRLVMATAQQGSALAAVEAVAEAYAKVVERQRAELSALSAVESAAYTDVAMHSRTDDTFYGNYPAMRAREAGRNDYLQAMERLLEDVRMLREQQELELDGQEGQGESSARAQGSSALPGES